jgi:FkbM family methyltransferase
VINALHNYFGETRGRTSVTTAKVLCNKFVYCVVRAALKPPPGGWVHSPWHWFSFPFSLQKQILWSRPLRAWFRPLDNSAIEGMLHLPSYEPVEWVTPQPGQVFLDIGAYVGWYVIQAARAVGLSGQVVAIEPDHRNRSQLENNINLNVITNATIVPLAAWSHAGKVRWQRDSAEPVWHKIDESSGSGLVDAVTVDDLVRRFALTRVDWIKLDVEGAEVEVLKGAEQSIRRFHPALFIEVHGTLHALEAFLKQFGYSFDKTIFGGITANHGHVLATVK